MSRYIRSHKKPYTGTRSSIGSEYSSSRNAGNEMVTSISKYNNYHSDFESENLIRPSPMDLSRHNMLPRSSRSHNTVTEDIGESFPDIIESSHSIIPNNKHFLPTSMEKMTSSSIDTSSYMVFIYFLLIFSVIAIVSYYSYVYYQDKEKKRIQRIEGEYEDMMAEIV